jgi:integrase
VSTSSICARQKTRLYSLILLALATGARRGELLALQWADINFETGLMSLSKSLEQTKAGLRVKSTKSDKPRRFTVPSAALDALREHRIEQDRDRHLFGADYHDHDLVSAAPRVTITARIEQAHASWS